MDEAKKEASINIYGDITSWPWLESDVSSYILSKEIDGLDVDVIHVCINSYGGEVAEGWAIYNALKRHKAKIITHNDGFAASIASVIFMAGDERYMSDASLLFIHNAWTRVAGNAGVLRKTADDMEKMSQMSTNVYMKHVNITEEDLKAKLEAETWITPTEAVEWGFATAISESEDSGNPSQSVRKNIMQLLTKPTEPEPKPKDPESKPEEKNTQKLFFINIKIKGEYTHEEQRRFGFEKGRDNEQNQSGYQN